MRAFILILSFSPLMLLSQSTKIVDISNALKVTNPDSAGIVIQATSSGKNGIGVQSNLQNNEGGQTLKAFEGIINQASLGHTSSYGAFLEVSGTLPTGIYTDVRTTYTGSAYGARFLSEAVNAGDSYGILTTATGLGGTQFRSAYGGHFTALDNTYSTAVYGEAKGATTDGNKTTGGNFISRGTEGIGVIGSATSTSNLETFGGSFTAASHKGTGVYGSANGGGGNEDHYGGYFEALGNRGTGLYVNADSVGLNLDVTGPAGIQLDLTQSRAGTIKAIESKVLFSPFDINTVYGVHNEVSGRYAIGSFMKASSTYTGSATGGIFEALSVDNAAIGISASADGNFNSASRGGTFTTDSRFGIGVEGIATAVGGGSTQGLNKGGYFTSAGSQGFGVHAIASNSNTQEITYGGYFQSLGEKGIGVYATTDGGSGSLEHFGGYFRASGSLGVGTFSEGTSLAVHAKGKLLIEGKSNDAILSMQSIDGNQNRVIVLQDNNEDLFIGDIDGENRDVIFRSAGSNMVHLKNNYRVGIAKSNPSDFFQIDSPLSADGNFRVQNNGITKLRIYNNGSVTIGYNNGDAGVSRALQLQNSTNILLGNARANAWETHSDARVKSNGKELSYGLAEVLQLQPKKYNHHSSVYDESRGLVKLKGPDFKETIGFYAQEVNEIIPEVVYNPIGRSDDLWSMDYTKLIPVLTKAIQEQQAIIEQQKSDYDQLKKRVERMEALLMDHITDLDVK